MPASDSVLSHQSGSVSSANMNGELLPDQEEMPANGSNSVSRISGTYDLSGVFGASGAPGATNASVASNAPGPSNASGAPATDGSFGVSGTSVEPVSSGPAVSNGDLASSVSRPGNEFVRSRSGARSGLGCAGEERAFLQSTVQTAAARSAASSRVSAPSARSVKSAFSLKSEESVESAMSVQSCNLGWLGSVPTAGNRQAGFAAGNGDAGLMSRLASRSCSSGKSGSESPTGNGYAGSGAGNGDARSSNRLCASGMLRSASVETEHADTTTGDGHGVSASRSYIRSLEQGTSVSVCTGGNGHVASVSENGDAALAFPSARSRSQNLGMPGMSADSGPVGSNSVSSSSRSCPRSQGRSPGSARTAKSASAASATSGVSGAFAKISPRSGRSGGSGSRI